MIDFSKYPRTKEVTYTILERKYIGHLERALILAGETDWTARTCRVHDKSMSNDIKDHLPEWFDARYYVFISHFDSDYIKNHLEQIYKDKDKDVQAVLKQEEKEAYQEYLENYAWRLNKTQQKQKGKSKCDKLQ